MSWVALALLAAAVFGVVSMLDKHILEQEVRDVRTYYLLLGLLMLVTGVALLLAQPLPPGASGTALGLAVASGFARGGGLMLTFLVLRTEEVSRAVPVTQTFPVFVAILAALFLHEALGPLEWLAILVTVGGAVLLSARRGAGQGVIPLGGSFFLLLVASFIIGVANVLSKEALRELAPWNMFGLNAVCMAGAFFLLSARRPILQEAAQIVRQPRSLSWFVANQGLATVGGWLFFSAIALGPVSLAATLIATRPLFIFVYAVLSSWLLPRFLREPLSPRILAVKLLAIVLIVGGISRIALG